MRAAAGHKPGSARPWRSQLRDARASQSSIQLANVVQRLL